MSKPLVTPKVFDPVKLEQMIEPLSVRVEKLKGNTRTPIPLPTSPDGTAQGAGWSKEDVSGLEQWLVNEWSGGGMYALSVIDSTQPVPNKHEWQIFYPPSDYPEKVPPTLSAAMAAERPSNLLTSTPVRQMGSYPSAFPNGLPNGMAQPQPAPFTPFVVPPVQPAPRADYGLQNMQNFQAQAQVNAQAAQQAQMDADRRRLEDQLKEMQVQLQRAREAEVQAQHQRELERVEQRMKAEQQAQNEKFTKIEQLISQLATAATARPTGPDTATVAMMEQLKEQNRMLAASAENEKREREAERREQNMQALMRQQADENRRSIEAVQAQIAASQAAATQAAALAAATANKGPDPMVMFLQENTRMQAQAAKDQMQMQQLQMERQAATAMTPRDIIAMMKDSSTGIDVATRQITSAYTDVFNMQRAAVDQILQLNSGGGNETIALIEKGFERASSMAERYLGGKTKEAVAAQHSAAQQAQAQATAMTAQAQALTVQAQMQAMAQQQAQATDDTGLNGPRMTAIAGPTGETQVSQTSSVKPVQHQPDGWGTGPVPPITVITPPAGAVRRLGRTDEQWFGSLMLPKVYELREGVDRFIESLKMNPPRQKADGSVDGVDPEGAADVIMQATQIVMQEKLPILAMMDLLGQGRVADFMDVLLPNAPQTYRDDATQLLLQLLEGGEEGDEDEDEDEDDDDGEDNVNQEAVVTPAPKKNSKPSARA